MRSFSPFSGFFIIPHGVSSKLSAWKRIGFSLINLFIGGADDIFRDMESTGAKSNRLESALVNHG